MGVDENSDQTRDRYVIMGINLFEFFFFAYT